jgi:putative photosynthetic complex assembly protein
LKIIGVVLLLAMLGVAGVRLAGWNIHEPDAAAVATRELRFEDRRDGSVAVIDAHSGLQVDSINGEAGFLRGSLRALARERMKRDLGPEQAFQLIARADGRLTLNDPATGARLDLESFGPTNAAVFARLLTVGATPAATH